MHAARRLRAAGERAFARGDMSAAANLLGRAAAVLQTGLPVRLEVLPDLGEALLQTGRFAEAQAVLREAVEDGTVLGENVVAAKARLVQLLLLLFSGELENWSDEAPREIASAIDVFEAAGDEAGLAKAYRLLGFVYGKACRFGDAADAVADALEHARLANDVRQQSRSATAYALAAVYGPTPIREAVQRCASAIRQLGGDRQAEAAVLALLAHAQAMQGSFGEARDLYLRAREIFEELALRVEAAAMSLESGRTELLAGNLEGAEEELRHGYSVLGEVGERYVRSTIAGMLGEVLCDLGRFDEAEEVSRTAEELASEDDVESQALWRAVRARVLAHRGDVAEAESLARAAVELAAATDGVIMRLGVLFDLADVLLYVGLTDEAAATLAEAAGLAESKGNLVMAGRAAAQLEELRRQPFASQA